MLTACQSMMTSSTATEINDAMRVACESFEPITYSSVNDTKETVKHIREHNAAWVELCGTY